MVRTEYDAEGYLTKLVFQLPIKPLYFNGTEEVFTAERVVTLPRAWFAPLQSP